MQPAPPPPLPHLPASEGPVGFLLFLKKLCHCFCCGVGSPLSLPRCRSPTSGATPTAHRPPVGTPGPAPAPRRSTTPVAAPRPCTTPQAVTGDPIPIPSHVLQPIWKPSAEDLAVPLGWGDLEAKPAPVKVGAPRRVVVVLVFAARARVCARGFCTRVCVCDRVCDCVATARRCLRRGEAGKGGRCTG